MGIRLITPNYAELVDEFDRRMVLVDFEGSVWRCQTRRSQNATELLVIGETNDSTSILVPWRMPGGSEMMLSTATLIQRERPYLLTLELARGTLQRVLTEAAAWELGENQLSTDIHHLLSEARRVFAAAVTRQRIGDDQSERDSAQALDLAIRALRAVSTGIIDGLVSRAPTPGEQARPLVGCMLPKDGMSDDQTRLFTSIFDTAIAPFQWKYIECESGQFEWQIPDAHLEWCRRNQLRTIAGPLLRLNTGIIPDWLYLWENDQERLIEYAENFVTQVASRFVRRVNLWYASSGLNMVQNLGLTEESRLTMAARSVEIIRRADPQTPVMVGFEQPWGEYLARRNDDLSPIGFADALARSNLGISAIALELNFDIWPQGTVRRDPFAFLRKIDQWAQFQLPLVVVMTAPSKRSLNRQEMATSVTHMQASEISQAEIVHAFLPLLKAHPAVQGIAWNHWCDEDSPDDLGTGLLDFQGNPKVAHGGWNS